MPRLQNLFADLMYFNKTDAKDITWAHGVNSQEKLNKYLKTGILMFEADVLMRFNRNDTEPVMAHPPDDNSDLTLESFLNKLKQTRKGIKLDFKSINAVKPSMMLLQTIFGTTHSKPLWLNADILPGPGTDSSSKKPVDAALFIDICTKTFPNATLSLGWTTKWSKGIASEGYTWDMVKQMASICENTTQFITFPLRAIYVRRSLEPLKWLVESSCRYSVTIWSSIGDEVDVSDLVWLTGQVDRRRLYMDLPPELDAKLNEITNQGMAISRTGYIIIYLTVACLSLLIVKLMDN